MSLRLIFAIYTRVDTLPTTVGINLMESWFGVFDQLTPTCAGNFEPLRACVESPESMLSLWQDNVYWERKKQPKGDGVFFHKWGYQYSGITARYFVSGENIIDSLQNLFHRWYGLAQGEFGYLHLLTPPEADVPLRFGCPQHSFILGAGAYGIKPGMADLGWLTVWNKKAAERFGVHRLADKFDLRTEDNTISLRLTDRIQDVAEDFSGFCERRHLARQIIGEKHFFKD